MLIPGSNEVSGAATISGEDPWSPSSVDHGCAIKYVAETQLMLELCQNGNREATEVRDPKVQAFLERAQATASGDKPLPPYPGTLAQHIPGYNG